MHNGDPSVCAWISPKTGHGIRVSAVGPNVNGTVGSTMRSRTGPRIGWPVNEGEISVFRCAGEVIVCSHAVKDMTPSGPRFRIDFVISRRRLDTTQPPCGQQ